MAFIEEFYPTPSEKTGRPHSTCACGWHVTEREGRTVLQLDTYGSANRRDPGTVSQSLQIDEDGAQTLIDLIYKTFPHLRHSNS